MIAELEKIKNAQFTGGGDQLIFAGMREIIKEKTNNFTNPAAISTEKVDMTSVLEEKAISKEDYIAKFGSIKRSEADAVLFLASQIPTKNDVSKEKRVRIVKARAKALSLLLELEKI